MFSAAVLIGTLRATYSDRHTRMVKQQFDKDLHCLTLMFAIVSDTVNVSMTMASPGSGRSL